MAQACLRDRFLRRYVARSVSLTTRPKRRGEQEGEAYFFVSEAEFRCRLRAKKILEWTRYLGYYYGTPKDFVERMLAAGRSLVFCLDDRGAVQMKRFFSCDCVRLFVMPPSIAQLRKRIRARSTMAPAELKKRLAIAVVEMGRSSRFEYTLVNDVLSIAKRRMKVIVRRELGV